MQSKTSWDSKKVCKGCNKNCFKKSNSKNSGGNKIADKITSVSTELPSKKSSKELPNDETEVDEKRATTKKQYISPEER